MRNLQEELGTGDLPLVPLPEYDVEVGTSKIRIAELEREAITRSKDAAEAVQVHLDRYQSLIAAIAQVIWSNDPNGEMVGEQPSWAAYTGQAPEEYQGSGWLNAVHPADRARSVEVWRRAVVDRSPCEYEHRLRHRDGSYRHFSVRAVPLFAEDGAIREWAGIHSDITQRRLTEKTLRDGERRFRELADAMPQIVWEARLDGQFDYYNRRWYDFTGRAEGTRGNEGWAGVVHADDHQNSLERWHAALKAGDGYEIEHRLRRADGEYRWHLTRALPVQDPRGAITRWLGTCTDIHERKQIEHDLRSSTAMLEQSNRELEQFATVASHDLQEPLRKIRSFVGRLRDDVATTVNAAGRDSLNRIDGAAVRMTTLIADLLELSRISSRSKPFVPVDLNEVAAGVVSDLEVRLAQTGGRVEISRLPTVVSDVVQMRQLMQNLIGNALKFHRKDEPPVVRVSAAIVDATESGSVVAPDGTFRLSVADNGIGFDEKYLDRVFTIFQRLHGRGEYEGTGIGLAICRRIVERHNGTITARSKPGQGATFIVTLPLCQRSGGEHGK